jgi:hypothetical protein
MSAGVYALIGVIVGALITGGITYALQVRAERRELRAVARLMLQELDGGAHLIRFAVDRHDRALLEDAPNEREWKRHHLLLARHLPDDQWDAVALAYGERAVLSYLADEENPEWLDDARRILPLIDAGIKVLRAHAHRKGWEQPGEPD